MITVSLQGGLGNQLFQIAAVLSLAKDNNDTAIFDIESHRIGLQGNNAIKYKDNIYKNLNIGPIVPQNIYNELNFHYDPLPYKKDCIYNGYFQTEKYFSHNSDYIKNIFKPVFNKHIYIPSISGKKLLSLHIRRGDYLNFPTIHPFVGIDYINNALSRFDLNEYIVLIFSDDINWCKTNININNSYFVEDLEDYEQLWLMSLCDDHIISNSSFGWWGAYLNKNQDKKIIAPNIWFGSGLSHNTNDIYTKHMIKI